MVSDSKFDGELFADVCGHGLHRDIFNPHSLQGIFATGDGAWKAAFGGCSGVERAVPGSEVSGVGVCLGSGEDVAACQQWIAESLTVFALPVSGCQPGS
jgi:hypothetical protein